MKPASVWTVPDVFFLCEGFCLCIFALLFVNEMKINISKEAKMFVQSDFVVIAKSTRKLNQNRSYMIITAPITGIT